jgi:hypothetical protein
MRREWAYKVSRLAFAAFAGAWAVAYGGSSLLGGRITAWTAGYACGGAWLVSFHVCPTGFVRLTYIAEHHSLYDGFFARASRDAVLPTFTLAKLVPCRDHSARATIYTMHLALPIIAFGLLTVACAGVELIRRYRRRRTGRCVACGYDLTGNESGVCSECGCVTSRQAHGVK